jgi:murein DD-endopeptidase MepM/ murein hydrolase activator NlpD
MTPLDQLGASALPVAGPSPDASPERIQALAAQFESLLLAQMLKEMRASMFDDEEGSAGLGTGPLGDALFSELSLALSRTGGIGLADAVMSPLIRQAGSVDAAASVPDGRPNEPGVPAKVADAAGVAGRVTSTYGWREDPIDGAKRFHHGVDIALPIGHEVPAARAGRVTFAGDQPGYGLTVVVDHGDGIATRYAHLSSIEVRPGDEVDAGQVVAQSGASGRATGPHLHVELIEAGKRVNPAEKLRTYVNEALTGR